MRKLDEKKLKAELLRVQSAKAEMEYRIEESLDQIERLNANILTQEKAEQELLKKLGEHTDG